MGYRLAPSEAAGVAAGRKPLHLGLISYRTAQPR